MANKKNESEKNNYNRNNYRKRNKYKKYNSAAFFAGVGYGKASNGEKHLGFNSDKDRKSFVRGAERHKEYFTTHGKATESKSFITRFLEGLSDWLSPDNK